MSNDAFDGHTLSEKLSKLNNSQQSIESLSRWCVSHQKKAKQIVDSWDKLFSSQKEKRVSFLYLANDILQNSRRKGSEFVNEFWKVLPSALKHVYVSGDENGKKAVTRLVGIWEERKVFGSRGQNLKDELLCKSPPSALISNGKSSNPIKIVKRDAQSVRIKLAVGGLPEKIITAFHSVLDEHPNEEDALNKCNVAVVNVAKFGDLEINFTQVNEPAALDELQEQEQILQQCVGQLETAEATRLALIWQLKEALQDQKTKLEAVHTQLLIARGQVEQASNFRRRLTSASILGTSGTGAIQATESTIVSEPNTPAIHTTSISTQPPPPRTRPVNSFAPPKPTKEENKKSAAAALAAKLAASASSAQMLTLVFSSLVAEEAASMNGGLKPGGFNSGLFPPEKRQKIENADTNSDVTTGYYSPLQQPTTGSLPLSMSTAMQPMPQTSQMQTQYGMPPPLMPPSANSPASQYMQSSGMMPGIIPYGYGGANSLPPPPPPPPSLPPHISGGLARPGSQSQQQQQHSQATGGYYRPPGIGFYGQNPQATPLPVPRQ